jgi:hypothetical protein
MIYYEDAHRKITVGTWQSGKKINAQLLTKFIQTVAFNYSSVVHKKKTTIKENTFSTASGTQTGNVYFFKHAYI